MNRIILHPLHFERPTLEPLKRLLIENGACLLTTHSAIVLQEIPHTNIRKLEYNPITKIGKVTKLKIKHLEKIAVLLMIVSLGTDLRNTGFYKYIIDTVNNSLIILRHTNIFWVVRRY